MGISSGKSRGRRSIFAAISCFLQFVVGPAAAADPLVEIVYVVPSDRAPSSAYANAMVEGVMHFQEWLFQNAGLKFELSNREPSIYRARRPASFYGSARAKPGNAFYSNVAEELLHARVVEYYSKTRRYLVFVDADHACGQSGATAAGVAILSANDLRGLAGEEIKPACDSRSRAEIADKSRWIGGLGHELLHAFGLKHSDAFESCQSADCQSSALMKFGYMKYPNAVILPEELTQLEHAFR
jgi:hypothetical protein